MRSHHGWLSGISEALFEGLVDEENCRYAAALEKDDAEQCNVSVRRTLKA